MVTGKQLILDVYCEPRLNFANYVVAKENEAAVSYLSRLIHKDNNDFWFIYLHSPCKSGKTHLLKSCCYALVKARTPHIFLDLRKAASLSPSILSGLSGVGLVCLDNIENILGSLGWEEAIFNLYNELAAAKVPLVVSSRYSPLEINFDLPDLNSRMRSGLNFKLAELDDNNKVEVMGKVAKEMGFDLPDSLLYFMISHYDRCLQSLIMLVKKVGHIALSENKKPSLNTVKKAMSVMQKM
jgi:DnaA-homolog protein